MNNHYLLIAAVLVVIAVLMLRGRKDAAQPATSTSVVLAPEILMSVPYEIVRFPETGKRPDDKVLQLRFRLTCHNYFTRVPNGHFGVMLRANMAALDTGQYRGVGVVCGRFGTDHFVTRHMPHLRPVAIVETWAVGAVPPDSDVLLMPTLSPELQDGVDYDFEITSVETEGANRIGYTIHDADGRLFLNTGLVTDINPAIDMAEQGLAFFNATSLGHALGEYTIAITAPTVTWSKT